MFPKPGPRLAASLTRSAGSPSRFGPGAPATGPSPGPSRLLGAPLPRSRSPSGAALVPELQPLSHPPAPAEERSPENPRRAGGSAPRLRPLPAHRPRAALARPPPPLDVRATSASGPRAGGGASRRGRGLTPGAGRRRTGRGVACGLLLPLPMHFPRCRPEDLRKPHRGNAFPFQSFLNKYEPEVFVSNLVTPPQRGRCSRASSPDL